MVLAISTYNDAMNRGMDIVHFWGSELSRAEPGMVDAGLATPPAWLLERMEQAIASAAAS